jgi:hypothetical protein
MRYILIMMALFSLTATLFAKDISHQRVQILLEGKHLTKRYDNLINRQKAWQARKKTLIKRFNKSRAIQTDFGAENRYGTQREHKRMDIFYASLHKQEAGIAKELASIKEKLAEQETLFFNLFGVPLTREEMFRGVAPKVVDKTRKVQLLRQYLSAKKSWKNSLRAVDKFDEKRVALQMRSNLSIHRYEVLSQKLDKKVEKNYSSLNRLEEKSALIVDTYARDYGYSIPDENAAKILLDNIQHSD